MVRTSRFQRLAVLALTAFLAHCSTGPELRLLLQVHTEAAGRNEAEKGLAFDRHLAAIRNRVDQLGIYSPRVEARPGDRIFIRLPNVEDPERTSRFLRTTALLEMRFVRFPAAGGESGSREAILQHYGGRIPPELEILEGDAKNEKGELLGKRYYAVEKARVATGGDVRNARPGMGQFGNPIVEFTLTPEAAKVFGEATANNVGSCLALVLDGRVLSAPMVRSRISDRGQIEGGFTEAEAQDLAILLRSGALPVRVTVLEEQILRPQT